jgi:hypothetical protein
VVTRQKAILSKDEMFLDGEIEIDQNSQAETNLRGQVTRVAAEPSTNLCRFGADPGTESSSPSPNSPTSL